MSDDSQPLPCPSCETPLVARSTPHGLVWACLACRAGATTWPVLKRVAPREFTNRLWLAARDVGSPSESACPSCSQPLLAFDPAVIAFEPSFLVCCRCFLVWLDREVLDALPLRARSRDGAREGLAVLEARALGTPAAVPREARDLLRFLADAAEALAPAIDESLD